MNASLYNRLMEALTYAVESTAHRRDPKVLTRVLMLRDDLQDRYPEFADAARADAAVDAVPRFEN